MVGVKEKEATKPKQPNPGSFYTCRQRNQKPTIEEFKIQRMTSLFVPSVIHADKSPAYIPLSVVDQDHSHREGTKVLESKSIERCGAPTKKASSNEITAIMRNSAKENILRVL